MQPAGQQHAAAAQQLHVKLLGRGVCLRLVLLLLPHLELLLQRCQLGKAV
jgi:hypothetical protein